MTNFQTFWSIATSCLLVALAVCKRVLIVLEFSYHDYVGCRL